MRRRGQKLGSPLVPSAKPRLLGRNGRSRRYPGPQVVCGSLLQLFFFFFFFFFGFFAPNWLCSHWNWKTPARWDPSAVMLSCDWICFYKRGRFDHWVFRVLSTNRSETKADVGLHLVCGSMATGVIHVRCFLYLWMLLLTPICKRAP